MRKTIPFASLLLVVCLAAPAHAGDTTITPTCTAGTCTDAALSTLGVTSGAFLGDMRSFRITVCAASGQTLSGAGTLEIGYMSPLATYTGGAGAVWSLNKGLTLTVTSTLQCETFPDQRVLVERGRLYVRANGVTVSGGASLTISIEKGTLQ